MLSARERRGSVVISEVEGGLDDAVRDELVARFALDITQTRRLSSLMTFVFADANKVLKIVHESHRDESHLLGEIDFVEHLAARGISVAKPLRSQRGKAVERMRDFLGYAFERLAGQGVARLTPPLIEQWGALLARIHAASTDYAPALVRRPQWDWGETDYFERNLRDAPLMVRRRAAEMLAEHRALPRDRGNYGLIHGDPHHWNLLLRDGELSLIDFDDCVYGWFVADIASALYYAVNNAGEFGQSDAVAWFRTLRNHLLHGYERVRPGAMTNVARWLPQFLLASSLHDYVETMRLEASHAPELGFRSLSQIERDLKKDRWNDPRLWQS